MKKNRISLFSLCFILLAVLFLPGCLNEAENIGTGDTDTEPDDPVPAENTVIIFQVYGAGFGEELGSNSNTNTGSVSHNFIELYNNSGTPVDVSGYSVQWANGKANGGGTVIAADQDWNVIPLTGTIPAYGSYLIRGRKMNDPGGDSGRLQITESDLDDENFYMSNRSYKVALVSNQARLTMRQPWDNAKKEPFLPELLDLVGARNGNNDSVEGYKGTVFSSCSKQKSIRRVSLVDTGDNNSDFVDLDYRTTGLSGSQTNNFRPRTAAETAGGYAPVFSMGSSGNDETEELAFSHESGLYNISFNLALTAREGSRIYYSIDGSIPLPEKAGNGTVFEYNSPIAVKNRNAEPNLLATYENIPKMYPNLNDPENNYMLPRPYYPGNVPKATVIRAMAVDSDSKQGGVITKTYFIGNNPDNYGNNPVISVVTDPGNLLDDNTGIYVQGKGNAGNNYAYNYKQKGREWEREADLNFFDGTGNEAFSAGAGIRVRGGFTRCFGQKSFNIYFREEYGLNNLKNYVLIPGAVQSDGRTPVAGYKNFMLRNGGNDTEYTKMRDVYIQSLLADRNFTIQAAIPCIVYLNGEYWGFYNLQEKYSDNYLKYKFGVSKDNVVSIETGELAEGVESDWALYEQLRSFRYVDMANPAVYREFCDVVDIQSYIDYFAAEIYIGNHDWPSNNYQLWRVRDVEPDNPYGDGKWRWMLFDVEFSMGLYSSSEYYYDTYTERIKNDSSSNSVLFKNLLKNTDFCRQFVITMMDLYNVNFDYASSTAKLDEMANVYRPLINDYYTRFGGGYNFESKVNGVRYYLSGIRDMMTNVYLPNMFGHLGITANKLANVTLSAKSGGANVPGASITINTTTPALNSGNWTGKYYSAYPVTVTANVPGGSTFTGWTVTGGAAENPSELTTSVTFSGDVQITANYN